MTDALVIWLETAAAEIHNANLTLDDLGIPSCDEYGIRITLEGRILALTERGGGQDREQTS